jgi:peptidoglycan/LPS O-acetylase OafA/YrhL
MVANPVQKFASQKVATGPRIVFAVSIIVADARSRRFALCLPREALLPATVTVLFVLAAAIALFASRGPVPPQFTYWEAAGLLTAIGIIASVMVEPGDLVRLVVDADRRN